MSSDSYYMVYIICGLFGMVALLDNRKAGRVPSSKRERGFFLFGGILYAAIICAANYHLFEEICLNYGGMMKLAVIHFLLSLLLVAGGSFLIAYHGLLLLSSRIFQLNEADHFISAIQEGFSKKAAAICFAATVVIDLFYLFGCAYPGVLTTDSLKQIEQTVTHAYSNHHPLIHTLLIQACLSIGKGVFHSPTTGVAIYSVFQILFMAFCYSYAVKTLSDLNVRKPAVILAAAWFVLMPFNIVYSVTMWKDVIFSGMTLLLVSSSARLPFFDPSWNESSGQVPESRHSPESKTSKASAFSRIDAVIMAISAAGVSLFRSNGWIAFTAGYLFILILHLVKGKKKVTKSPSSSVFSAVAAVIVIIFVLRGPFLNALGVTQPDFVESLSIPGQQVARVLAEEKPISERDHELIAKVADPELIKGAYSPGHYDYVKDQLRRGSQDVLAENKPAYLALWGRLGLRYPGAYFRAWIDQTKGYWNGGYPYWVWGEGVPENEFGIIAGTNSIADVWQIQSLAVPGLLMKLCGGVRLLFYCYMWFLKYVRFFEPLKAIGLHVWILMAAAILAAAKQDRRGLLCVLPLMIIFTLCLATPEYTEFRYAFGVIQTVPFIVSIVLLKNHI